MRMEVKLADVIVHGTEYVSLTDDSEDIHIYEFQNKKYSIIMREHKLASLNKRK